MLMVMTFISSVLRECHPQHCTLLVEELFLLPPYTSLFAHQYMKLHRPGFHQQVGGGRRIWAFRCFLGSSSTATYSSHAWRSELDWHRCFSFSPWSGIYTLLGSHQSWVKMLVLPKYVLDRTPHFVEKKEKKEKKIKGWWIMDPLRTLL